MTFLENDFREIITKAVCGKGRKYSKSTHTVSPNHRPTSILGCWIINHKYHAKRKSKDKVEISGNYDINIWYSYHDNTKTEAITERVTYQDIVPLSKRDKRCFGHHFDVIANVTQQPNCLECKIDKKGYKISVEVERGFVVKVIGETKVFVKVDPQAQDYETDYSFSDEELKHLNPDFTHKEDRS